MSEAILNEFLTTQKKMTRSAMRVVLSVALSAHILLNAFAYINNDPILKVEMPILSGVTIIAILISIRIFKHG